MKGGSGKGEIATGLMPLAMTEKGAAARNDTKTEDNRPENTKAVTSDQWPVTSEGKQDQRPLIHYVFEQENTYETEIRGKKALGVRDLGKGGAVDLVIPEHFAPYERVYLGWDPVWIKRNSDWLDIALNILGFIPFGVLLVFASRAKKCLSVLVPECLSEDKEGTRDAGVGTSAATRQGSGIPASGFGTKDGVRDSGFGLRDQKKVNRDTVVAVVLAVVAGLVVSFAIEYLQAYLPSRDSSLRDLVTNTAGTLIGALAAVWYSRKRIACSG
jgi:hypothetical protein